MKIPRVVAFLLTLALAVAAVAADKRPLTPQDLWAIKRLGSPALSPDGKTVVFTQQEWSIEKNKSTSNLWLADVATGTVRRLTTAAAGDSSPVWSPDGTRIAFTSKRGDDEAASLYVIPFGGGEAEKILELPGGVSNPKWLPDGQGLVVATTVVPELAGKLAKADLAAMKQELKRRKESKMTAKVTENRQYRYFDHYLVDSAANRLVRIDLATRAIQDLTPQVDRLFTVSGDVNYEISPDGKSLALEFNSTPPPYRDFPNADIYLVPTDGSGAMTNLTPENRGDDSSPTWAPDGQGIYFTRTETPYYSGEFAKVWRHDLAAHRNVPITDALDYSIDDLQVSDDGKTLWLSAEDRGVVPIFKANADGSGFTAVYRQGTSTGVRAARDTIVFLNDTTSRPAELFVLDAATGTARQLTHVNDAFMAQLDLGRVESYTFAGAGGAEIQGWLVFPPGYDAAKQYPLVQLMHGGPHTMCRDSWSYRWNTHVFAAPGYVVTWVNRHGSTGFGEEFSRSILNQWGDMPFEDIMRSTDYLLDRFKNLDPQRLAAAGASYGGYMAAWVLGHTDRFKAIIDHAGVNDSYAQYATDVPHGFPEVMGGKPWDNLEGMQRQNPMFYAKNFKTPTLVLHGEIDYRVPYGNGLELYGVLQAMGVPSRLVVFPDENHWVLHPQNAIYWHWEMQHWLSRYIGGQPALEKPNFDAEKKPEEKKDAAPKA
ncbi:prolyl oligopeptidase family serine peptidase [Oleiharenicola sp. Vm1]|uniref:prolyl oligopeptidase family serine peptidase n=1 Tax=Oleiharenicola sp. Vm1 TaxID=3398393 RepID=UPI0039F5FCB5